MKFIILTFLFLAVGCASTSSKDGGAITPYAAIPTPPGFITPPLTTLTTEGENSQGSFSNDDSKIIFKSLARADHTSAQIYILNLQKKNERRITYNDGNDSSPHFSPDGRKIIYSSTTDEIKEHPDKKSPTLEALSTAMTKIIPDFKFLNYDIYQADLDGSHIIRLTQISGFDSSAVYSSDGKKILFTSDRDGDYEIYSMSLQGAGIHRLTSQKGYDGDISVSPSTRQLAWTGFHSEKSDAQIFVSDAFGRNPKPQTTKPAVNWQPSWSPNGKKILFSSNRDDEGNFEIYVLNVDEKCVKRLTYAGGNDLMPIFSHSGTKILFTSNRTGKNQLFLMDFIEPKDCLPDTP